MKKKIIWFTSICTKPYYLWKNKEKIKISRRVVEMVEVVLIVKEKNNSRQCDSKKALGTERYHNFGCGRLQQKNFKGR